MGLAIVIGSAFVMLALVLLALLIRRYIQQQRARTLLSRYEYSTPEHYVSVRVPESLKPSGFTGIQESDEETKFRSSSSESPVFISSVT
jgi:hypothetical protein